MRTEWPGGLQRGRAVAPAARRCVGTLLDSLRGFEALGHVQCGESIGLFGPARPGRELQDLRRVDEPVVGTQIHNMDKL